MERNEVSIHEVRVYLCLQAATGWLTSREIAVKAEVAERTARAHAAKLVALGLVDLAEVFPAHRYRVAAKGGKRNTGYARRLAQAAVVFGLEVAS